MVVGSSAGSASGFLGGTPASETDGETFDGDADFEEYDEWDYAEILASLYVFFNTYASHPLSSVTLLSSPTYG